MTAPVFAFGLVAFGFLGMGPVTIAVDSLRPGHRQRAVGLRALASSRRIPDIKEEIKKDFGFDVNFEKAKHFLEENDGAGNTFKATAKPVLIGTAVVGATTMIFSIIMALTHGLDRRRSTTCRCSTRRSCSASSPAARSSTGSPAPRRRRCRPAPTARSSSSRPTSSSTAPRRPRSPTARRSSRSARSTRRRACSTSSSTVFFSHAGLRLPRAVLLHRLPDLDRALRPLPGDLHGQRRRRLGQRQEGRRGRAEGEGHRRCTPPASSATPSAIPSRTPRRWP